MGPYSMAGLLSCALRASSQRGAEATTPKRGPAASSYLMKTAENRHGNNAVTVANAMAGRHRREVGRIRNAGSEAAVRTPAIVMRDPLAQNSAQVIVVAWDHPIQAFAANGADHAFTERVRLRGSHRRPENRQPHRR